MRQPPPRRVLLVGASGVFGGRLATLLATIPEITIVLCGRRPEPLAALRRDLQARHPFARIDTATIDREWVVVAHPWTGLLFAYRGRLDPLQWRDSTKG